MNNKPSCSKSKADDDEFEDEIFDDSIFLAAFDDNSFKSSAKLSESNINDSHNKSTLNVSALCCDEEISGYDKLTGKTWIYPTNYPVRDYQFNIIQATLLKNTLVSLPTGLGKTFIAAVIMYNFYRWYPLGKIIFMAPTRPLVAQQIEACYNIIAIPPTDTIEMTGHMQVNTRKGHWQTKRVFFATPQVINNDIKSGICPSDKIRCLVMDEAHRARGNYAYGQIVATMDERGHKTYRLLALSATPGSKVDDVVNVIKSLHIAHLELRTENCIDVAPYSHARKINTVIVPLGREITQLRQHYIEILDVYARRLKLLNILPQNLGNLSKGRIVMLYKEFQSKERGSRHPQHGYIMKDFTLLIVLYHGLELLVKHGTRVFLNFFDEHPEKTWIQFDDKLTALLERLRDDLGINPLSLNRSILPDGTIPEIPKDICFGHPKFDMLKKIMVDHFTEAKRKAQDTRAIVFCEYRESVNLVHCLLLQCRPLITPQMFVGQGASGKDGKTVVSQKQQLRVMRSFREGAGNVLVATCVAEEGLDVGSVDLIVIFDVSNSSPIRLVQRCGRTGRERGGTVHILVTEGREHQTLMECMRQRDGLNKKVIQSKEVANSLYKLNPRMLPRDFMPQCQKMYISVAHKADDNEKKQLSAKKVKGQKDLRTMFLGRASSGSGGASKGGQKDDVITEDEFKAIFPNGIPEATRFVQSKELWPLNKETFLKSHEAEDQDKLILSDWLDWQRTLQRTLNVGHSKDSEILAQVLQYSDAKRFDMPPATQNTVFETQALTTQIPIIRSPAKIKQPRKKQMSTKSPAKKDGDIRALFSTATKSTRSYTKLINDLGIQDNGSIPTSLINLIVDLNLDNTNAEIKCYICQNICDCTLMKKLRANKKQPGLLTILKDPTLPDLDLIDDIDPDTILKCVKNTQIVQSNNRDFEVEGDVRNCSNNFDLDFDFGDFNSPGNEGVDEKENQGVEKNFDIGDIEDIFADSSPEEAIEKAIAVEKEVKQDVEIPKETKTALAFFGLDSIDDIFADDDSLEVKSPVMPKPIQNDAAEDNTIEMPRTALSPSILSGKPRDPSSPILCTQVRKFQLSTKKTKSHSSTPNNVKKSLFQDAHSKDIIKIDDDEGRAKSSLITSLANTSNKSMFTVTQLVEMINSTNDSNSKSHMSREISHTDVNQNDRSTSPILLTQADRKKYIPNSNSNRSKNLKFTSGKSESLIILDSDSDSNDTEVYDFKDTSNLLENANMELDNLSDPITLPSTPTNKRKYEVDADFEASPFFSKKPKLENNIRPLTIQEKVLAALNSNKSNQPTVLSVAVSQPNFLSQKENENPILSSNKCTIDEQSNGKFNLDMLKMFRRDSKINVSKQKFDSVLKKSPVKPEHSQMVAFSDSDDDFVDNEKNCRYRTQDNARKGQKPTNQKIRKKKNKRNSFLEFEAELSGSERSGDELTDDSIGSIIDFICDDDNAPHHEDMQAHYLKSIKSPIKGGGFKIPELPKKYNKAEVFSQFVEEDAYEMDSFCVDSRVELTQVNEVSDLELAEMVLEEERRAKRRKKQRSPRPTVVENGDSPIVRRKNIKRRIESDSDDSS